MDKMSKKPSFKIPTHIPSGGSGSVEPIVASTKNVVGSLTKWVPLICAGSAIGISMFALKEIKNTRRELINLKKEQYTAPNNDKLEKKMELMEKQLNKLTEYIKNSQVQQARNSFTSVPQPPPPVVPKSVKKEPKIVKNVVNAVPEEIKIINKEPSQEDGEEDEYEEVEVTDDEAD
jgi:hypothetical protein